jgi:hypothetical protein
VALSSIDSLSGVKAIVCVTFPAMRRVSSGVHRRYISPSSCHNCRIPKFRKCFICVIAFRRWRSRRPPRKRNENIKLNMELNFEYGSIFFLPSFMWETYMTLVCCRQESCFCFTSVLDTFCNSLLATFM